MNFSAIILAGGASRRMGRDKAWLETGGKSLLDLAFEKAQAAGAAEIFISGRPEVDYSSLNCPVLTDEVTGFGPLAGIERGLGACHHPMLLVLAVDLPCITADFLIRLAKACDDQHGAVPRCQDRIEPLVAFYPKTCLGLAVAALRNAQHRASDFAQACARNGAVRWLDLAPAESELLANWNTPADMGNWMAGPARPTGLM